MPTALVTGATGFIGPHLVRELQSRGQDVACLRREKSNVARLEALGVRFVQGDVTNAESLPAALRDADVVYHLAGLTRAFSAQRLLEVNAGGTRNLLAACAERQTPPTVLLVSSLAAGGPSRFDRPREEDDPPRPVSNYGRSKRAAEEAAHEFADRLPITVVRPPIVFGEGDDCVLQMFKPIKWLRLHFTPTFFTHRFSLIHAADLASHVALAAEKGRRIGTDDDVGQVCNLSEDGKVGQVCNLSEDGLQTRPTTEGYYYPAAAEHPTMPELGKLFGQAMGRKFTGVVRTPIAFTWIAAALNELFARIIRKPQIFNLDKAREAAAGSWTCSPRRSRDELGWSPSSTLQERLAQTVEWYRRERWL